MCTEDQIQSSTTPQNETSLSQAPSLKCRALSRENILSENLLKTLPSLRENPVISPLCLMVLLAVLARISHPAVSGEIDAVLGDKQAFVQELESLNKLPEKLNSQTSTYLQASSLWIDERLALNKSLLAELSIPSLTLNRIRFDQDNQQPAINEWIHIYTGGLIDELPCFSDETCMAGLSALYFKDAWKEGFSYFFGTHPFQYSPTDVRSICFMESTDTWDIAESEGSITLAKDLSSGARMIFSLPPQDVSLLDYVASGAAWDNLCDYILGVNSHPVHNCEVFIPSFTLSSSQIDLQSTLNLLGITRIFHDPNAFLPLSPDALFLSSIQQDTHLEVDEDGIEGASLTAFAISAGIPEAPPEPSRKIFFDRPFVVAVTAPDNSLMFLGLVTHPSSFVQEALLDKGGLYAEWDEEIFG